jgi:hypothetical protein
MSRTFRKQCSSSALFRQRTRRTFQRRSGGDVRSPNRPKLTADQRRELQEHETQVKQLLSNLSSTHTAQKDKVKFRKLLEQLMDLVTQKVPAADKDNVRRSALVYLAKPANPSKTRTEEHLMELIWRRDPEDHLFEDKTFTTFTGALVGWTWGALKYILPLAVPMIGIEKAYGTNLEANDKVFGALVVAALYGAYNNTHTFTLRRKKGKARNFIESITRENDSQ